MKRILMEMNYMCGGKKNSGIFVASLLFVLSECLSVLATQTEVVDGIPWSFVVSNYEARIVGSLHGEVGRNESVKEHLDVPAQLGGYPVTAISDDAFVRSLFWNGLTLKCIRRITIPSSICQMHPRCLKWFRNLQEIDVDPENKVYGSIDGSLYRKGGGDALLMPPGRMHVSEVVCKDGALLRCPRDASGDVVVPVEVKHIADCAFVNCYKIRRVVLPSGIESIGESAFCGCVGLTEINLPNSLTNIGERAFAQCIGLKSVVLPKQIPSIGLAAFASCKAIVRIDIPANVKSIGRAAFYDCRGLKYLNFANGVVEIGDKAFAGCENLERVFVPVGVELIGEKAFVGCANLREVDMPSTLRALGDYAFQGCMQLELVVFRGKPPLIKNASSVFMMPLENLVVLADVGNPEWKEVLCKWPGEKRTLDVKSEFMRTLQ